MLPEQAPNRLSLLAFRLAGWVTGYKSSAVVLECKKATARSAKNANRFNDSQSRFFGWIGRRFVRLLGSPQRRRRISEFDRQMALRAIVAQSRSGDLSNASQGDDSSRGRFCF
ncbi:MAG: hypothetical protein AAGK93_06305 [Pseudomonadota bacterium]